ncbi:MAG TPA: type 2 lanthipeptide synthetase LanM family protein [Anaerolineae bacterium]|nr:type 2 lanthipeptide synthetase LanM family protein [Anaerolineae bacterium]
MNQDTLLWLAYQASFLHERLVAGWRPQPNLTPQLTQQRLARWCATAADGDWQRFEARLAWSGLDMEQATNLLGPGKVTKWEKSPPSWLTVLTSAFQLDTLAGWLAPFMAVAEQRLPPTAVSLLSPTAQSSLRAYLQMQLEEITAPTLAYVGDISLIALYERYPVLVRQMATKVEQWVAEVGDFNDRIRADWGHLTDLPLHPHAVTHLQPNLSDPHHAGRTVWRVELVNGQAFAYKPKAINLDDAWQNLVRWANQQGVAPSLTPLWTLSRAGYGWMAWADKQPIENASAYYRRVGAMLAWLHQLHATDIHYENLVTQNDCPVLVDAEMLVYPQVSGQEDDDPLDVLRTGLLPRWQLGAQGVDEIGGLMNANEHTAENIADIMAGYHATSRFITKKWALIQAGPLLAFQSGSVRFAPRPTAIYSRLLTHLRHPAFLDNGIAVSIELDRLARAYAHPEKANLRSLLLTEQTALSQGDIPFFVAHSGQNDLSHPHGTIRNFFSWPPFTPPQGSQETHQLALIQASLDRNPYMPTATTDFLAVARQLGQLLADRAVLLGPDRLSWTALQWQAKSGLYQHRLVEDDLYAGRAGIALFLGALGRVTKETAWRDLALASLRGATPTADSGGRLYTLALLAHWLDAPCLIDEALSLAKQTSKGTSLGVVAGQAGMVLGLLKLYELVGKTEIITQAIQQGDMLLNGWADAGQHRLGGFSHGAAGIAYSLARLYAICGVNRFRNGAQQLWRFQQTLYEPLRGQWQDRRGAQPAYLDNWCHGSAGIGLAGAGIGAVLPETDVAVAQAVACLTAVPPSHHLDTLCCGGWGQIACLQEMGLRAGNQQWLTTATTQAKQLLAQRTVRGYFQLYDDLPPHLFNPTFFRGLAGIGYTLLRLAAPDKYLPCILSMAPESEWHEA